MSTWHCGFKEWERYVNLNTSETISESAECNNVLITLVQQSHTE